MIHTRDYDYSMNVILVVLQLCFFFCFFFFYVPGDYFVNHGVIQL